MPHVGLKLITAPAIEPVTLDDVRDACRITSTEDDLLLGRFIEAARQKVEIDTQRRLITQTWDVLYDELPTDHRLTLPLSPIQSVTSIKTTDTADVETTWASTNYGTDLISTPPRIFLKSGASWPTGLRSTAGTVVRVVAGYGAAATDVPWGLREAVLQLVAHLYEHREPLVVGPAVAPTPLGYEAFIQTYWVGLLP